MKPILLIAGFIISAALVGTGALSGNNAITLIVQDFGFGEGEIISPIETAAVDFEITAVKETQDTATTADDYIKNVITACSFHTNENLEAESMVICKLQSWELDENGVPVEPANSVVICEYSETLPALEAPNEEWGYLASDTILINEVKTEAFPGACEASLIDGVQLIVKGPEPIVITP